MRAKNERETKTKRRNEIWIFMVFGEPFEQIRWKQIVDKCASICPWAEKVTIFVSIFFLLLVKYLANAYAFRLCIVTRVNSFVCLFQCVHYVQKILLSFISLTNRRRSSILMKGAFFLFSKLNKWTKSMPLSVNFRSIDEHVKIV